MAIQIDQSGKIEDTARDTVVAISNGKQYTVLISAKTKRQLQEVFRQNGKIKSYVINVFAFAVYTLLKEIPESSKVIIDIEYPHKDGLITTLIKWWLNEDQRKAQDIVFDRIGNTPKVHYLALDTFRGKKKADKILKFEYILKKQKDRWALKRMSFNSGRRSKPRSSVRPMLPKKRKMSN